MTNVSTPQEGKRQYKPYGEGEKRIMQKEERGKIHRRRGIKSRGQDETKGGGNGEEKLASQPTHSHEYEGGELPRPNRGKNGYWGAKKGLGKGRDPSKKPDQEERGKKREAVLQFKSSGCSEDRIFKGRSTLQANKEPAENNGHPKDHSGQKRKKKEKPRLSRRGVIKQSKKDKKKCAYWFPGRETRKRKGQDYMMSLGGKPYLGKKTHTRPRSSDGEEVKLTRNEKRKKKLAISNLSRSRRKR